MTTKPRLGKKAALLVAAAYACAGAHAQDASWIIEPEITPGRLASDGAVLTANESVRWPEGPSVDLTYWLGAGDVVYRCATLLAEGTSNASCWRRQFVARASDDNARHYSTRQRPPPILLGPAQSSVYTPYVWFDGMPWQSRPPLVPRPTPLPTR